MLLHEFLSESAARDPDHVAIIVGDRRLTYAEVEAQSSALAGCLVGSGLKRGDRVGVFLDNRPETVVAFFAVLKAGGAFLPINPTTRARKLCHLLSHSGSRFVVTDRRRANLVKQSAAELPELHGVIGVGGTPELPESWLAIDFADAASSEAPAELPRVIDVDLAALIYTSGSTGQPKGVMHTHASLVSAFTSITMYLENTADDVILSVLPLAFVYGLGQVFTAFRVGATLVLENSMMYPAEVLAHAVAEGATGIPFVPTIAALFLQTDLSQFDFSKLRYMTNAGAPLPEAHLDALRERLPHVKLFNMYGQTECIRASYLPPSQAHVRARSVGMGIPNQEVYVVDADGNRAAPEVPGELVVRGSQLMLGYWNMPEETAAKLRPGDVPGSTVLMTGDLFRTDEEGYLYFVSRQDDIIKTRGEKVAPKEVEEVLYRLDAVAEAAVVGVPDDVLGEVVKAALVLKEGAALERRDVLKACSQELEDFMIPKIVEFRESLPKTDSGKIRRKDLVDQGDAS
ncbi:MAG: AMP-binding protein [Verrucomicrobia bacterium]|jgi:long-chain acyl-CoA synthetase|nr:AMP-binding protein [Verrucomicrobiota bacterium]